MNASMHTLAVFPGQGAQHIGMGKDLYDNFKIAQETFEEASDASHLNIKKICFDGPESELNLTENTQPCLLTTSIAAFRVAASERGFIPNAVAGHSLGEYAALVVTEAISLATAAKWVRARGLAMQEAVPVGQGAMAAVMGLDDIAVNELCKTAQTQAQELRAKGENRELSVEVVLEPANFNAPGQIVIAGSVDAISAAVSLAKAGQFPGARIIPLSVSAPFHCRLMKPARDEMAKIFAESREKIGAIKFPYFPNCTARMIQEPGLVFEFLIEQIDKPVLWNQSIVNALDLGFLKYVEFGPGKVLQGLVKRIANASVRTISLAGISDTTSLKGASL